MSERTLSELADAEIVPDMGGPNAWLVRFSEGEYDTVNKSGKNTLLLKGEVDIEDTATHGGVTVDFNLGEDAIMLKRDGNEVRVPAAKHENVLWAVYEGDGPRLNKLHDELYTPTVRKGLMDQFMPRFRQDSEEIRKTDEGWLITGDILVSWDAGNHPVDVATTHVVRGGRTVEADEDKKARKIQMPSGFSEEDSFEVTAPDGRTFNLDGVELKFLTTVGLILDRNPANYDDDLSHTIGNAIINGFTDTKSGLYHDHPLGKHKLEDLGVTEEAQDRLWYNDHDHTGVWEMAIREQEFRNAPIDVFENAANDDAGKWSRIYSTKDKAPIPKRVRSDLEERYGDE